MKVLIFTHKNDIDGMGNAVLSKLAFDNVDYVLCETFDLIDKVNEYINTNKIYDYDKIFITDLCSAVHHLCAPRRTIRHGRRIVRLDASPCRIMGARLHRFRFAPISRRSLHARGSHW